MRMLKTVLLKAAIAPSPCLRLSKAKRMYSEGSSKRFESHTRVLLQGLESTVFWTPRYLVLLKLGLLPQRVPIPRQSPRLPILQPPHSCCRPPLGISQFLLPLKDPPSPSKSFCSQTAHTSAYHSPMSETYLPTCQISPPPSYSLSQKRWCPM